MTNELKNGINTKTQNFYDGLLTSVRQMKKGQTKPIYTHEVEAAKTLIAIPHRSPEVLRAVAFT